MSDRETRPFTCNFIFPNPDRLREMRPFRVNYLNYFPIPRVNILSQSNCPKKLYFYLRTGSDMFWVPPNYGPIPGRYYQLSGFFNQVINESLFLLRRPANHHLSRLSPQNSDEWTRYIQNIFQQHQFNYPFSLIGDILDLLELKFQDQDLIRYSDPRIFPNIYFRLKVFNPHVYLFPQDPNRIIYSNFLGFSWRGDFPCMGMIDEIDFSKPRITEYVYTRENLYPSNSSESIERDPRMDQSDERNQLMFYHCREHQLWLIRLIISTLNSSYLNVQDPNNSQTPNLPEHINEVLSQIDWSQCELYLETPEIRREVIDDYLNDTVRSLIIFYLANRNPSPIFRGDFPCSGDKDQRCNFIVPCRRKRTEGVFSNSTNIQIRTWLNSILKERILEDISLYSMAQWLPNFTRFLTQIGWLTRAVVNSWNPDDRQLIVRQMRLDTPIELQERIYICPWSYFFGPNWRAIPNQINDDEITLLIIANTNLNEISFANGHMLFIFRDKSPDDPRIETHLLSRQQRALFWAITHQFQYNPEDPQRTPRKLSRRGSVRITEATYGDNTQIQFGTRRRGVQRRLF